MSGRQLQSVGRCCHWRAGKLSIKVAANKHLPRIAQFARAWWRPGPHCHGLLASSVNVYRYAAIGLPPDPACSHMWASLKAWHMARCRARQPCASWHAGNVSPELVLPAGWQNI